MSDSYDVIVIGAGPAGYPCAIRAAQNGLTVACIDEWKNYDGSHAFGGTYTELTPHGRIRYTDKFEDPDLPGEMHITVELKEVLCGTELQITQEGVPAVIPAPACYMGWQESLFLLAQLVEPEIPDQP